VTKNEIRPGFIGGVALGIAGEGFREGEKGAAMGQQIDLATTQKPVRDFIRRLGKVREPVELLLNGNLVARIIAPTELSDAERQRIVEEGWAVVEKARGRTKGIPASVIQGAVDKAVREVRARHDRRRR
jgi:hypothetical protein